ncbi:T-complex protein 11-domain-containing protein [Gorgonomyces haynaldii]|nr:T-complex protein 11-domain-containing protein [Gorgonomyces haynaldii]
MTRSGLQQLDFHELTKRLQSASVIKIAGFFLVRAKKLKPQQYTWKNPGRVFLSSYVMSLHPDQVFETFGPQEEDLKTLASQMLTLFDVWLQTSAPKHGRMFLEHYSQFYEAFEAWKNKDSIKIIEDLVRHFMELEGLWLTVMHQEDADHEWGPNIEEQQKGILLRLKKFGTLANERLQEERSAVLDQVRQTNQVEITNDVYSNKRFRPLQRADGITPEPVEDQSVQEFGSLLSNEKLAHELVMDPKFELKAPEKSEMELRVAEMAKKAFADQINSQVQEGKMDGMVLEMIMNIKQGLLSMISEENSFSKKMQESLEPEFVKHKMQNNAFDLMETLQYLSSKMLELCAPVRDPLIRQLQNETDAGTVLIKMMDLIEDMKLDLANYRLQQVRPHLMRQAAEYERIKFDEQVEKGMSLKKTEEWIAKSYHVLKKMTDERNPENIDHPDLKVKYEDCINQAYLDLLFSKTAANRQDVAETLQMDADRLLAMQNELQALGIVSALTMIAKNLSPELRQDEIVLNAFKNRLLGLLGLASTNIPVLASAITDAIQQSRERRVQSLNSVGKKQFEAEPVTEELKATVKQMLEKTVSYQDPLFSLLSRRIMSIVKVHLDRNVFKKETLQRHGLSVVEKELHELSNRIVVLCNHNKTVHYKHYNAILDKLTQ